MKNKNRICVLLVLVPVFSALATAPLIGDVPDRVVAQDDATGMNYFVIGDAETTFTSLAVTAVSSNTNLVPNTPSNLVLGGSNAQRTIQVAPVANQTGTTVVTLTVTDGEALTASSAFNVTVTPPNTAPSLTGLAEYQIASPGQTPPAIGFSVGDAETAVELLNVTAISSNTKLVPNANLALGGSGANRTVQVVPVAGQSGTAVIKLRVVDALGASAQAEFIFSVFDPTSVNNAIRQPRGIYVLDSVAGTQINGVSMRDANVRDKPFLDGYVLRTEWSTLEPVDGLFDFTIVSNIFAKLPASQKLSLLIGSGSLPAWLNTLPGVDTYTAGSPSVTRPLPWNAVAQERFRLLMVALGDYAVDGVPLRDSPRLAALDAWIPGLKSGIRDPGEIKIRDLPDYSRTNMQNGVLVHLANVTENFPNVPVQIGFWTYVDNQDVSYDDETPWEQLRQAILAEHDGVNRPRVGFWMENLAANRPAAEADPWAGLPNIGFSAPLHLSQNNTFIGYQVLGSWSRPFNPAHVDNNLNGTPEDGMDYGFNTFQCRYYEHYQADVDFANYADEFQRWHDFLNALPDPPLALSLTRNGDNSITLDWPAAVGGWYQVEVSSNLVDWAVSGNSVQSTATTMSWTDDGTQTGTHPSVAAKRFYRVHDWGVFDVEFAGGRFTYTDSERTVTGLFIKPEMEGRLPALIINHGTGGTTQLGGFTDSRAKEMSPWGLFCIGPDLTHAAGATEDLDTWGFSPENLARDLACVAALSTRSDVDLDRLAMWGHSRGAFTSIGVASVLGGRLRALGFSAGGVHEDGDLSEGSFPTVSEASGIAAPTIIFHGSTDGIVDPATSQRLKELLDGQGVPNDRILYDTTSLAPSLRHNLHQTPAFNTDMLAHWQAWLAAHGVLP